MEVSHKRYAAKLKSNLNVAVEAISFTGKFAGWEPIYTPLPAWICVDGVGDINLPLSEEQIQLLISKAHQAPDSGSETETPEDKLSVGNYIWEIKPSQLEFLEPAWQGFLVGLSSLAADKLGLNEPIRLDFHGMMIYGKGAVVKPKTDATAERTRGMFGTLMICLPSAHEGGEVRVEYNGEPMVLGGSDSNRPSFACWYSDVTHEVLPVQSGYRCVLTYNLATRPDSTRPTASALDLKKVPLRNALEEWINELGIRNTTTVPSHVYDPLGYEYGKPPTSIKELNLTDSARIHLFKGLSRQLPFEIFLAVLEKNDYGPITREYERKQLDSDYSGSGTDSMASFHELNEVEETTYTVRSLHTLYGETIASDFQLDLSLCLDPDPFEDVDDPSEDCYDESASHKFRRPALVVVPYKRLGDYLARCAFESKPSKYSFRSRHNEDEFDSSRNSECNSALRYLGNICPAPSLQTSMLDAMCTLYISKPREYKRLEMAHILQTALQYSHYTLFQTVAVDHRGRLTMSFFDWTKKWLISLSDADRTEKYETWIPLLIEGYPSMADRIKVIVKMSNPNSDAAQKDIALPSSGTSWRITLSFEGCRSMTDRVRSILDIPNPSSDTAVPDAIPPKSSIWVQDMIRRCVTNFPETSKRPTVSDGELIASALLCLDAEWEEKSALITSMVERFPQVEATAFLLALLSQLKIETAVTEPPIAAAAAVCRSLSMRVFNHEKKLCKIITPAKIRWTTSYGQVVAAPPWDQFEYRDNGKSTSEAGLVVTPAALVRFASDLSEMSTDEENLLEDFIGNISAQSATFSSEDMRDIWMPFLYDLISTLGYQSVSLDQPVYQQLTVQFIKRLYDKNVGPQPEPIDVPCPEVDCTCDDCTQLNEFLRDFNQSVRRLPSLSKPRRQHMDKQLALARVSYTKALDSGAFVVTKNRTLEHEISAWKERQKDLYRQVIKGITEKYLQSLLGEEEATRIRSLAKLEELALPPHSHVVPPRPPAFPSRPPVFPPQSQGFPSHSQLFLPQYQVFPPQPQLFTPHPQPFPPRTGAFPSDHIADPSGDALRLFPCMADQSTQQESSSHSPADQSHNYHPALPPLFSDSEDE
ncbi:hypothetical protein PGT21_034020 [Puccinia graminis f. sp. tritici]|uniref:Prolyl 4-hydroxylase alpha subunit Fe(2+) 2OG dioxygenase domain-containing protein n=1 Tax=Puccinia graminis f. sp. tritici TaxID=56615 RepID=A0A5B0PZK8_PUCGR|nr:hypothetical protein PGT21_034020 [Puccinia graminis f. sp. tritici]KAA1109425.1 hypothetical protein PGTUg99_033066 [Puccinia graminis f. sp. tritici]